MGSKSVRAHQKYEIFSSKLRNYLKLVRIKKHKLWHVENGGLWLTSTRLWVQTQAGSPVWGLHVYQWKMHLLKPFLAQVPSLLNSSSIFLSLDSNRADFMIHSLKYVFLFCFVFFDLGAALSSCFFWNISPISCGWTTKHSILKNSVSLCSWTQISAVCK